MDLQSPDKSKNKRAGSSTDKGAAGTACSTGHDLGQKYGEVGRILRSSTGILQTAWKSGCYGETEEGLPLGRWLSDISNKVSDENLRRVSLTDEQLERLKRIGFKQEKKTYVRCNTAKAPVEEIKRILSQENVSVADVEGIPYALEIKDYDYIAGLKSFRDGLYQIQDISSMTAGYVTGFKAGDTVIDVCAAPGGKSVNAAISVGTDGKVYSRDVSDYKAGLIEENISRLGLNNIEVQVKDALVMDESMREKADVVIADLPCSGLGVMGRKPDIRYNITEDKLISLKELQQSILSVVQAYVKQGGIMMYSTCTINSEENEANADWLCKEYGFKKIEYRQILPGKNGGTDGFFVAKLRRE